MLTKKVTHLSTSRLNTCEPAEQPTHAFAAIAVQNQAHAPATFASSPRQRVRAHSLDINTTKSSPEIAQLDRDFDRAYYSANLRRTTHALYQRWRQNQPNIQPFIAQSATKILEDDLAANYVQMHSLNYVQMQSLTGFIAKYQQASFT